MIEIIKSPAGHPVIIQDGIYLGSKINPLKQAEQWLKGQHSKIENFELIFVLGLGSGYHIEKMMESYPDKTIIVIESSTQIAKHVSSYLNHLANDRYLIIENTPDQSMKNKTIFSYMNFIYSVVIYQPSWRCDPLFYQSWWDFLIGRNVDSFKKNILIHNLETANWDINFKNNHILSIKDLINFIKKNETPSNSSMVWEIIGEVIK